MITSSSQPNIVGQYGLSSCWSCITPIFARKLALTATAHRYRSVPLPLTARSCWQAIADSHTPASGRNGIKPSDANSPTASQLLGSWLFTATVGIWGLQLPYAGSRHSRRRQIEKLCRYRANNRKIIIQNII